MAKRNVKKFDRNELDEVLRGLIADRDELYKRLHAATDTGSGDYDHALWIRDMAQLLVATCMVIESIPTTMRLAELSGEKQTVPSLDKCGLHNLDDYAPTTPETELERGA